jgi:hypothetical protein
MVTKAKYGESCANCGHYFAEKSICTLQNPPEKIKQPAFCPACDEWTEREIYPEEVISQWENLVQTAISNMEKGLTCFSSIGTSDAVEHPEQEDTPESPAHYKQGGIECIDAIRAALGDDFTGFCVGNVMKYVWRFRHKNGKEDLKKAAVYLQWAIESLADKE